MRWGRRDVSPEVLPLSPNSSASSSRTPGTRGSLPIPKRWAVERTYGRLMLHRRLARNYETLPARSGAMIHLAMTGLMACRLTGEAAISWHDPTPQTKQQTPGQNAGRKRPLGNDGPQGGIEIGEEQPRRLRCRFSLSMSCADAATWTSLFSLTACRSASVSDRCHFLRLSSRPTTVRGITNLRRQPSVPSTHAPSLLARCG